MVLSELSSLRFINALRAVRLDERSCSKMAKSAQPPKMQNLFKERANQAVKIGCMAEYLRTRAWTTGVTFYIFGEKLKFVIKLL